MERKLMKSRTNKVIWGVCGGIGEYFNIDPTIIRVIWLAFTFFGGAGVLLYFIAGIIMPMNHDIF